MLQVYRRTSIPKCGFNKVAKQLYWNHALGWVFSCNLAAYFHNVFSQKHLWRTVSAMLLTSLKILLKGSAFSKARGCTPENLWKRSLFSSTILKFCAGSYDYQWSQEHPLVAPSIQSYKQTKEIYIIWIRFNVSSIFTDLMKTSLVPKSEKLVEQWRDQYQRSPWYIPERNEFFLGNGWKY